MCPLGKSGGNVHPKGLEHIALKTFHYQRLFLLARPRESGKRAKETGSLFRYGDDFFPSASGTEEKIKGDKTLGSSYTLKSANIFLKINKV